jgi:predicted phosphodiesterase
VNAAATDVQLGQKVVQLKEEGRSFSAIGDVLGITRDRARRLYSKSSGAFVPEEPLIAEWLRPVQLPAPKPSASKVLSRKGCDVILSDFHWPKSSASAEAIAITTIKELQPERVILNGDLWDLMAFSRFDQDYRKQFHWTPQDEADAGAKFLYKLEEVVCPNTRIIALPGNHEERWWRYLNQNVPQVVAMKEANDLLAFKKWWVPSWSRLEMQDEDIVLLPASNDPLLYTHGEIVRAGGGVSSRAHGAKYHSSVLHGHTHRIGSSISRIPAVGERPESLIRTYESGCMSDLQPMYSKKPDWANGFAIVQSDEKLGAWSLDQVVINEGAALINSLGATIIA